MTKSQDHSRPTRVCGSPRLTSAQVWSGAHREALHLRSPGGAELRTVLPRRVADAAGHPVCRRLNQHSTRGATVHTATQLDKSHFAIQVDGRPSGIEELLPAWRAHDRFAIVVLEPFGALGASLLIQA